MAVNQARLCSPAALKLALGLIAIAIGGYILGPPLYWQLKEGFTTVNHSSSSTASSTASNCPACVCDCSSQPLLSISEGMANTSFADCAKHDPAVSEDTEKNFAELLSEELKIREVEAVENQKRAEVALLEAKKMTSQFQKEADKCNSGMATCEEAREKAETALVAQKKMSEMWEQRARQKGWKAGVTKINIQSQGGVQSI